MQLMKSLVILIVIAGAIYLAVQYTSNKDSKAPTVAQPSSEDDSSPTAKKDKPRLEEKFGFTSEGVGP